MNRNSRYKAIRREFESGRHLDYRNREIVLRAGETPQGVYFINKGFIKVYSISDHGNENLHIIYKTGELFPLIWAINGTLRSVSYESVGPSQLYRLTKEDFVAKMHGTSILHQAVIEQFADQFQIYADRIDNLEYTEAIERVAYRLLTLAHRFGEKKGSKIYINAPITHQHIAESINLARETVSREIEILEKQGLLAHKKRQIILTKLDDIKKIVGDID